MSRTTPSRLSPIVVALVLCAVGPTATPATAESDPAKGEKGYRSCKACHSLEAGQNNFARQPPRPFAARYSPIQE